MRTTCNRDCPDACTLEVRVDDAGRAVKMGGAADDPVTRGFLCERTSRFLERQYSRERLTQPLMRRSRSEGLQPVSWEEALDYCAERFLAIREESGPAAVLHCPSGGSLGLLKKLGTLLFQEFGPVSEKVGDICSGAGEAGQVLDFGICESHDIFDLYNSRSIIVWGRNIHASSVHLVPILVEAQRRGAKIIGVDVVRTRMARLADTFLRPNPGCDAALAFAASSLALERGLHVPDAADFCDNYAEHCAMLRERTPSEWAELAGVTMAEVEEIVQALTVNRPCAILVGWGLGRRLNGGTSVRALDALSAVTGNLGVAGGGVSYYFRRRGAFDISFCSELPAAREFREACLGKDMLAADFPKVRAVWVTAANPLAMLPDAGVVRKAFEACEMVVVVDTHHTDTTSVADVVLPTLTLLEDDDLMGAYGNHYLRVSRPTVAPVGESRHELWIWQEMARRWGFPEKLAGTPREWKERICHRLAKVGITLEQMEQGPVSNPFAEKVLFAGGKFPTQSGNAQLLTEAPAFPQIDVEYPLTLLAVSSSQSQSSQWSVDPGAPEVRVHPDSAGHLVDKAQCRLESRVGSFEVRVIFDEAVHPRVVHMKKGREQRHGGCANLLVEAHETDIGGGAAYYDQPVRLIPLAT